MRFQTIIWSERLLGFSTCHGCMPSLHRIIQSLGDLRSIRCLWFGCVSLSTFLRFARNEHSAGTYKSILPTVGFVAFQSKTRFRTIPRSRVHATSGSATPTFSAPYSSVSWKRALGLALSAENVLQSRPADATGHTALPHSAIAALKGEAAI